MTDETPGPQGRKLSLAPLEFEEALRDLLAAGPHPTKNDPPQDDRTAQTAKPPPSSGGFALVRRIGLGRMGTGRGLGCRGAQRMGHAERG